MKKKVLTAVLAAAVAVSAAVPAFGATQSTKAFKEDSVAESWWVDNAAGDDKYIFVIAAPAGISKVVINVTVSGEDESYQHDLILQNNADGQWGEFAEVTWGPDSSSTIVVADNGDVVLNAGDFKQVPKAGAEIAIILDYWWGKDFAVNSLTIYDLGGKVTKQVNVNADGVGTLAGETAAPAPAAEQPAVAAPSNPKTGDTSALPFAVALFTTALGAFWFLRKRANANA